VVTAALRASRVALPELSARAPGATPGQRARSGLLAQRHAVRRVGERFAVWLRIAVLERGARLAREGVLPSADHVFGLTLFELSGPASAVTPASEQTRSVVTGPDLAMLGAEGSLVLAAANVTLPLTVLVPAVEAVVGRFDTPLCDGALAAAYLGVPFRAGTGAPVEQVVTVDLSYGLGPSGVADDPTEAR
jgi:hypothetical protein